MADWLYLVIGIAVLAVLTLVGFVVARRPGQRGTGADVVAPPAPAEVEAPTEIEPGAEPLLVEPEPVAEPGVVERPEGTASRLVRLRQRLAGSQGGLGRGLLALLSRDRLDEDTWESIEDTLLTADVGVARPGSWSSTCAPGCAWRAALRRTPAPCCARSC